MASVWSKTTSGTSPTSKNVHVQVSGWSDPGESIDWSRIVDISEFSAGSLRLDAVNYAISDKTEVLLAWDKKGQDDPHVFLPLNGRGRLDFDNVNGLQNTVGEGRTGHVLLRSDSDHPRRAYFTLTLDFSKQGK